MVFVPFKKGGWCRRPWCQRRVASVTKRSTFPLECRSQLKWLSVIHPRYERPALRTSTVRSGRPQGKLFGGRSGAEYSAINRVSDDRDAGARNRRRAVRPDHARSNADRRRLGLPGSHRACPSRARRGGTRCARNGRAARNTADRSWNELCRAGGHPPAFGLHEPASGATDRPDDGRPARRPRGRRRGRRASVWSSFRLDSDGTENSRMAAGPRRVASLPRQGRGPPHTYGFGPASDHSWARKPWRPLVLSQGRYCDLVPSRGQVDDKGKLGRYRSGRRRLGHPYGSARRVPSGIRERRARSAVTGMGRLGAIAAAVEGLGIVMTPLGACRRELERGELVRLLPEWDAGTVVLNAVYASGRAAKPSARAFVDYLIPALHETEVPPPSPSSIGEKPRPSA